MACYWHGKSWAISKIQKLPHSIKEPQGDSPVTASRVRYISSLLVARDDEAIGMAHSLNPANSAALRSY